MGESTVPKRTDGCDVEENSEEGMTRRVVKRRSVSSRQARCVCGSGAGCAVEGKGDRSVGTDPERDLPISARFA